MSPDPYLAKSRRALASAHLMLADGDTEGACNRAYYAMFDAAHAALLAAVPDFNTGATKTHQRLTQHIIPSFEACDAESPRSSLRTTLST